MRRTIGLALGCMLAVGASAQAADFYLHNTLDLSNSNYFPAPLFDNASPYGVSPSAVATDGTSLWVAGFNNKAVAGTSGIVKIANPWGTASATSVTSYTTNAGRGFSGLDYDYQAGAVLAAWDNGSSVANGITSWNPATDAQNWTKTARGGSGVGADPGYGSVDSGAAWTTFGAGRRALQNSASGADIYTTANGMIINAGTGTFWRDMDFAPDGDVWARRSNGIIWSDRTGGNSCTPSTIITPTVPGADSVNGQNIAYLHGRTGGDLVVYNDRPATGAGQLWGLVTKFIRPDGTPEPATYYNADGSAVLPPLSFALGVGYYDYAWDAANQALIVSDFNNRLVYQFKGVPVPEPTALLLLAFGGAAVLRRRHG